MRVTIDSNLKELDTDEGLLLSICLRDLFDSAGGANNGDWTVSRHSKNSIYAETNSAPFRTRCYDHKDLDNVGRELIVCATCEEGCEESAGGIKDGDKHHQFCSARCLSEYSDYLANKELV